MQSPFLQTAGAPTAACCIRRCTNLSLLTCLCSPTPPLSLLNPNRHMVCAPSSPHTHPRCKEHHVSNVMTPTSHHILLFHAATHQTSAHSYTHSSIHTCWLISACGMSMPTPPSLGRSGTPMGGSRWRSHVIAPSAAPAALRAEPDTLRATLPANVWGQGGGQQALQVTVSFQNKSKTTALGCKREGTKVERYSKEWIWDSLINQACVEQRMLRSGVHTRGP